MYQLCLGYPFGKYSASTYKYLPAPVVSASLAIWSNYGFPRLGGNTSALLTLDCSAVYYGFLGRSRVSQPLTTSSRPMDSNSETYT